MSNNRNFTPNNGKTKKRRNERAHQMKIYSIGSVLILLAIVLLLNILLDNLLGKALTFDFSIERSNSISQESEKFLATIPDGSKVRIVGLFEMPDTVTDTKYQYIVPLLGDYVRKSRGKVTVEYVDIQKNPGVISELDPSGVYDLSKQTGKYAISYNGKLDLIDPINCYTIDTEYLDKYDAYMATGNNAEYTFTNSMMSLVKGYTSKAYIVTGLKEEKSVQLKKLLTSLGVETSELAAASGFKIPDDCNLLIFNGPNTDITESMYVELQAYFARGGKIIIAVDYYIENTTEIYKNLNRFLNALDINIETCVVSENDPSYQLNTELNDSLADVNPGFAQFTNEKKLHITLARPIGSSGVHSENVVTTPILTTSAKATKSVANSSNQAEQFGSDTGAFNVGMYAADTKTMGEVFVFGTLNFTSDDYFNKFTLNDRDADFTKAIVRSMIPSSASYNINIPVKKIDSYMLAENKATTSTSTGIMIVFMIVLPIILTSMAVIVYNKRKNL